MTFCGADSGIHMRFNATRKLPVLSRILIICGVVLCLVVVGLQLGWGGVSSDLGNLVEYSLRRSKSASLVCGIETRTELLRNNDEGKGVSGSVVWLTFVQTSERSLGCNVAENLKENDQLGIFEETMVVKQYARHTLILNKYYVLDGNWH